MPPKLVIEPADPSTGHTAVSLDVETLDDVPGTDDSDGDSDGDSLASDGDVGGPAVTDEENDDVEEDEESGDGDETDGQETAGGSDDEDEDEDEDAEDGESRSSGSKPRRQGAAARVAPTDLADLPGELQELAQQLAPDADIESSDEEEWGDRLQQSGLLGDNGVAGEALLAEHPEAAMANVDEVRAAANIIRDSSGLIIDPYHTTTPIITRYEYAKVIGQRAEQIAAGGALAIEVPHAAMTPRELAEAEFKAKAIPFIIRRPLLRERANTGALRTSLMSATKST